MLSSNLLLLLESYPRILELLIEDPPEGYPLLEGMSLFMMVGLLCIFLV